MSSVVDIHVHFLPPGFEPAPPAAWVSEQRRAEQVKHARDQQDLAEIVAISDRAGVDIRVLSLPAASFFHDFDRSGSDVTQIRELNDYLAKAVEQYPDRFRGLGTIDAFAGEESVDEVRRVAEELGLSGIVVDSARGDQFLGEARTVDVLREAARLGLPVFVHPAGTSLTPRLIEAAGQLGSSYGRGLANGIALLSLINGGHVKSLEGLDLVFTTLGLGSLGITGVWRERADLLSDGGATVHFDTMGFDAKNIAYLVSVLGADRVLLGSDWPHQVDATRERVEQALTGAGLSQHDQALVRGGNALRLLGES